MSFPFIPAPSPTPGTPPDEVIPSSAWLNEHTGNSLIAVAGAFMGICAVFMGLRFWSRRLQGSSVGLDDYLIYPALAACWISQATCIAIVPKGGVGTRAAYWEVSGQEAMIAQWAKYIYVVEMCYLLAACLTKLSILAIFLRILRDKFSRRVTYALTGITMASYVAESVACSLQCIPFERQWELTLPGGHCFDQIAFYEYLSIPNILTDLALLVLPIPTVWKLHANRSQKIQLSIVFATGSFGIVASVLRFTNFFTTNPLEDPTFNSVVLLTWTVIEPAMYLISACLPTLRPLLNHTLEKAGVKSQSAGYMKNSSSSQRKGPQIPFNQSIGARSARRFPTKINDSDDEIALKDGTSLGATIESPVDLERAYVPMNGEILRTNRVEITQSDARQWR